MDNLDDEIGNESDNILMTSSFPIDDYVMNHEGAWSKIIVTLRMTMTRDDEKDEDKDAGKKPFREEDAGNESGKVSKSEERRKWSQLSCEVPETQNRK